MLYYVPNRQKGLLIDKLKEHCTPGSIVMSDCHTSYLNLGSMKSHLSRYGFYHYWINHSHRYVHEKYVFIHQSHIESTWMSLKS